MGPKSEVREDRTFEQRKDPGAYLDETMVLGLEGHIMARYSEWRVLEGGDSALGQEGVLTGSVMTS
jgi:hypothetical protein